MIYDMQDEENGQNDDLKEREKKTNVTTHRLLQGKTFGIYGRLAQSHKDTRAKIEFLGGECNDNLTARHVTHWLISTDVLQRPKLAVAKTKGICVLRESWLNQLYESVSSVSVSSQPATMPPPLPARSLRTLQDGAIYTLPTQRGVVHVHVSLRESRDDDDWKITCSCRSWQKQKTLGAESSTIANHTCKHLIAMFGREFEQCRVHYQDTNKTPKLEEKGEDEDEDQTSQQTQWSKLDVVQFQKALAAHMDDEFLVLTASDSWVRVLWRGKQERQVYAISQADKTQAKDTKVNTRKIQIVLPSIAFADSLPWTDIEGFLVAPRYVRLDVHKQSDWPWPKIQFVAMDSSNDILRAQLCDGKTAPQVIDSSLSKCCLDEFVLVRHASSTNWYYLYPKRQARARVALIVPGRGKYASMAGSLLCTLGEDEKQGGGFFHITRGLTVSLRKNPPNVGQLVLFQYEKVSDKYVPMHATFVQCENA